jgi:hypothetical protein
MQGAENFRSDTNSQVLRPQMSLAVLSAQRCSHESAARKALRALASCEACEGSPGFPRVMIYDECIQHVYSMYMHMYNIVHDIDDIYLYIYDIYIL